jgi:hypothetical protein
LWPYCVPIIANAQGKRHYCAAAHPEKLGAGRNDRIGSRKGSSHARDNDRSPGVNSAEHCRRSTGPEQGFTWPRDAAAGIGR